MKKCVIYNFVLAASFVLSYVLSVAFFVAASRFLGYDPDPILVALVVVLPCVELVRYVKYVKIDDVSCVRGGVGVSVGVFLILFFSGFLYSCFEVGDIGWIECSARGLSLSIFVTLIFSIVFFVLDILKGNTVGLGRKR